jgi:hypothetical protein
LAGPYLGAKYRAYASWGQDAVLPDGDTFRQPFEALLRDRFVLGSPEEFYEQNADFCMAGDGMWWRSA